MMETVRFEHGGATYTVYELTVIQVSLIDKLAADIKEAWIKANESDYKSYPRRLDVLVPAYVQYMLSTDIEGTTDFINVNPALANGQLVDAYESWEKAILSNRELQALWDNAVKEANKALTDPEASSDGQGGENS